MDHRIQSLSHFLAITNDAQQSDPASVREMSTQLERMLASSIDVSLSDSLNDLLRVCRFEVDIDIGGALRCIHGVSSGLGQVSESDDSLASNPSFPTSSLSQSTYSSLPNSAEKNSTSADAKPNFNLVGSPGAASSRDVSTPYVKSGTNGDRLILGGRPCIGPLMELLLHTLRSHHNLTSIDVTSSALGDIGALALASASLSCSHLCVLGMSQNNIGATLKFQFYTISIMFVAISFVLHEVPGPEGASAVADAVVLHNSIHSLFLSSNIIGPDGAVSVARIIMVSTSLTALNLKSNRIGPEGTQR
jgi:hypothetical protein